MSFTWTAKESPFWAMVNADYFSQTVGNNWIIFYSIFVFFFKSTYAMKNAI